MISKYFTYLSIPSILALVAIFFFMTYKYNLDDMQFMMFLLAMVSSFQLSLIIFYISSNVDAIHTMEVIDVINSSNKKSNEHYKNLTQIYQETRDQNRKILFSTQDHDFQFQEICRQLALINSDQDDISNGFIEHHDMLSRSIVKRNDDHDKMIELLRTLVKENN